MSYSAAPPSYAPNEKSPYPTAPAPAAAPYPQQPQAQQPVIINVNNSQHQPLLQSTQEQDDALQGLEPFISAPSCKVTVSTVENFSKCKVVVNSTIHSADRCTLTGDYSNNAFATIARVATLGAANKRVSLTLNSANVNAPGFEKKILKLEHYKLAVFSKTYPGSHQNPATLPRRQVQQVRRQV
jgi:hypothetical protein